MSDLAPLPQGFSTDKLIRQRQASPHTIAAYRDAFTPPPGFVTDRTGRHPARMSSADLDATTTGDFLTHPETVRSNSTTTRDTRLAAIHSFFHHAAPHAPEHNELVQRVLAIPPKRRDRAIVTYPDHIEIDAVLAAPDRTTRPGRHDHTLPLVAFHTGLRVSELTGLTIADVHVGPGPHLRRHGKGRKDRVTPLTPQRAKAVRVWIAERAGHDGDPLFPTRRGTALSPDAVEDLVTKHATTAQATRPTPHGKNVTPHTLRHSCAMALSHAGIDASTIALRLGHESPETTQIYPHADMTIKERALDRTKLPDAVPGRHHAPDALLAFLANL